MLSVVVATPGLASHATPSRAAVGRTGSARAFAPTMKWDVNIARLGVVSLIKRTRYPDIPDPVKI